MSSGGDVVFEFKHIQADVTRVVESVILRVLKGQTFAAGRVSDWNDAVTRRAVNDLVALSPNFKFVVTATIGERALTPLANARYDPSPSHAPRARALCMPCRCDVLILCYRTEPPIRRRRRRTLTKADLLRPVACRVGVVDPGALRLTPPPLLLSVLVVCAQRFALGHAIRRRGHRELAERDYLVHCLGRWHGHITLCYVLCAACHVPHMLWCVASSSKSENNKKRSCSLQLLHSSFQLPVSSRARSPWSVPLINQEMTKVEGRSVGHHHDVVLISCWYFVFCYLLRYARG